MIEFLQAIGLPLVWPIVFVLLAGAFAYVLSRSMPGVGQVLSLAAPILVVLGGIHILQNPDVQRYSIEWFAFPITRGLSFSLEVAWTPLGMVVLFGAAGFALLITVYSFRAMAGQYWEGKFYAYVIWTLAGACIVALAGNLFTLVIGWELTTLMLFLMVNQGRRGARTGAAKAYGMLGFADACLLLAVALMIGAGGSAAASVLTIPDPGGGTVLGEGPLGITGYFVYVLILIAALAKAGAIPVHTWIPAIAQTAPTPVMAYLPAAVDKLLGIYLLAVLSLQMFRPSGAMQVVMMVVGAVTILGAVLMAMVQHNLKRLLSFHAVSQVGYMVLGVGTGTLIGVFGGLFHMINHAIYKSNLFLMSGAVGRASGSDEIEDMGGLARYLPITFVCGAISAMAISGVPPLNGFASKWMVYQGALSIPNHGLAVALLVAAVFGSALTLASFVKVIYSAFLSAAPKRPAAGAMRRPRESFFLAAPMVVLALACVGLGLAPRVATEYILRPGVFDPGTGKAVPAGQDVIAAGVGLWEPDQATVLIAIGLLLGGGLVWVATRKQKVRVVRPFLAGEVPAAGDDRFRVPGTHFYETISKLPAVGALLTHGEGGAMDPYYWSGKHGNRLVQMLRGQHTGLINLYVAWVLIGIVVTLVYLILSLGT
jgi:formate hydrogenlyase subunit 3/multisubunit Na+/H+ antiporter MnhD subunit